MSLKTFCSQLFLLTCWLQLAAAVKLNERRILLPFNNGVATNFTLVATNDACYEWTSSRPEVAIVQPILDPIKGCAQKAEVVVVTKLAKRQSSIIFANNKMTGSVIRCDVEIDLIKTIEIVTTTKEIVLDDLPERLEVHAKNERNDTFTSIGGIQFEWSLEPSSIIKYRRWSTSLYVAPTFVQFWESRNSQASTILLEGVRTGLAKVKVAIRGDPYKDVQPYEIELRVIAILGLIPALDVYLMKGAAIQFKAELIKQGPSVPVKLPSPNYYLDISDSKILSLEESTSKVFAIENGYATVNLVDRNAFADDEPRQQATRIYVNEPSYLKIEITPGGRFVLTESMTYTLTLTVYDNSHNPLYLADNLNLKVHFPSSYFSVEFSTKNGTYHVVKTLAKGSCKINAKLMGAGNFLLLNPIELTQEVVIYPHKEFRLDTSGLTRITNFDTHSIPILIMGYSLKDNLIEFSHFKVEDVKNPIKCQIYFDNGKTIWDSELFFDSASGQWHCKFIPQSNIEEREIDLSSNITILASFLLKSRDDSDSQLTSSVTVPFLPAFRFTPKRVSFSAYERNALVSVFSVPLVLDDVEVTSIPNVIQVVHTETINNCKRITLRLMDFDLMFVDGIFRLHLSLKSKLTMQNEPILVHIKWNETKLTQVESKKSQSSNPTPAPTVVAPIRSQAQSQHHHPQLQKQSPNKIPTSNSYPWKLILFTFVIALIVGLIAYLLAIKNQTSSSSTNGQQCNASFQSDSSIHTPVSPARALNFTPTSTATTPTLPKTRVGRPLYTVNEKW